MKATRLFKLSVRRSLFSALILALLCSLLPVGSVSAAGIEVTVAPSRPQSTAFGGTVTFEFTIKYQSIRSYAVLFVDDNTTFCRFYDMDGTHGATWDTLDEYGYDSLENNCAHASDKEYVLEATLPPNGSPGDEKIYSKVGVDNDIEFHVPATGFAEGIHDVTVVYYNITGEDVSYESQGATTFVVTATIADITLKKYNDKNHNGEFDLGTDAWIETPRFRMCLKAPYTTTTSCKYVDDVSGVGEGDAVWTSMPSGIYEFSEVNQAGWVRTEPTTNPLTNVNITGDYVQKFGNYRSDMACKSTTTTKQRPNPISGDWITYHLTYDKLYDSYAIAPTISLYFDGGGEGLLSGVETTLGGTLLGGNGTSGSPYIFTMSDITNPITNGTIDVTFRFTNNPASTTINAYSTVGSTYEPVTPANNNCAVHTDSFVATATSLSSFSAAAAVDGVALTWWANGSDTVAFKIKSKPEGSSVFSDVPGGFVMASDPAGKEYTFVDTTAQTGTTQYQLIPVDSSGKEGMPVELTAGYHKVFLPRILRK